MLANTLSLVPLLVVLATADGVPTRKAPAASRCLIPDGTESGPASQLSIFTKVLFYVREYHPETVDPRSRDLLVGALEGAASQDRAIGVERDSDVPPRRLTVTAAGHPCTLDLNEVNAPWSLRSSLQLAMRFIEGYLAPKPTSQSTPRLMEIEFAATNGMLSALDGHSRLLDPVTYRQTRPPATGRSTLAAVEPVSVRRWAAARQPVVYLRVRSFQPGVADEVRRALATPESQPPAGFVLDLRDNPGGLLDEAVKVADAFIKEGHLGSIVRKRERKDLFAHSDGNEPGGPLVVVVNRRTASASELVAAAIKNLGRGIVVGELTAGVGSIDFLFDIPNTVPRPQPRRTPRDPDRDVVQNILDNVKPEPVRAEPVKDDLVGDPFGLRLMTGRLLVARGAEIDRSGVRPDAELAGATSEQADSDQDCLLEFARALIAEARDSARSSLLTAAKALARPELQPAQIAVASWTAPSPVGCSVAVTSPKA